VTRKLQLLLFVCGSAVFAYLVARIGVGQLLADAARTGWLFVPIVLLLRRGVRLQRGCVVAQHGGRAEPPAVLADLRDHRREFSLNFMTPMVNVGGEPFKIAAVAPWLGLRRAAGIRRALPDASYAGHAAQLS